MVAEAGDAFDLPPNRLHVTADVDPHDRHAQNQVLHPPAGIEDPGPVVEGGEPRIVPRPLRGRDGKIGSPVEVYVRVQNPVRNEFAQFLLPDLPVAVSVVDGRVILHSMLLSSDEAGRENRLLFGRDIRYLGQ